MDFTAISLVLTSRLAACQTRHALLDRGWGSNKGKAACGDRTPSVVNVTVQSLPRCLRNNAAGINSTTVLHHCGFYTAKPDACSKQLSGYAQVHGWSSRLVSSAVEVDGGAANTCRYRGKTYLHIHAHACMHGVGLCPPCMLFSAGYVLTVSCGQAVGYEKGWVVSFEAFAASRYWHVDSSIRGYVEYSVLVGTV